MCQCSLDTLLLREALLSAGERYLCHKYRLQSTFHQPDSLKTNVELSLSPRYITLFYYIN